ncbi:uncharacterized protein KY384_000410 [Bacidia gigantensis]|uniref:uncharacterized protein n=1 Tax=Bacidia gigantensis TaxID=2732470 RepID=UPI001D057229|nr:uncharacterized protein KY384_000410 [Bacidia gigantensis]KAG8525650.1 hypothetical protein KY384_000410 [Bacidia gigantensis]
MNRDELFLEPGPTRDVIQPATPPIAEDPGTSPHASEIHREYYAPDALQVDQSASAPQVAFDSGAEAAPSSIAGLEPAAQHSAEGAIVPQQQPQGWKGEGGSDPGNSTTQNGRPTQNGQGNSTTTGSPTSSRKHGVYANSSFASVETSDRNRHVFFQDLDGTLRYCKCAGNCSVDLRVGIQDARNSTPMSAIADASDNIYLFYIQNNNSLTSQRSVSGKWSQFPILTPTPPSTTPTLKSLTANWISADTVFVLTQLPSYGATLLSLSLPLSHKTASWDWSDNTRSLTNSNSSFGFNAPFAAFTNASNSESFAATYMDTGKTYPWIAVFSNQLPDKRDASQNLIGVSYDGETFRSASYGLNFNTLVPDDSALLPADIPSNAFDLQIVDLNDVVSILYVENGKLVSTGQMDLNVGAVKNDDGASGGGGGGGGGYPFPRLSSFVSKGGKLYLYHQIDEGRIAESVFDPTGEGGGWERSEVEVPGM